MIMKFVELAALIPEVPSCSVLEYEDGMGFFLVPLLLDVLLTSLADRAVSINTAFILSLLCLK